MSLSNEKTIFVFRDGKAVADFAIKKWMEINSKAVADMGHFTAALSGGRTPVDFYKKLPSCEPALQWDKNHIFFADERFVPPDDPESNYRLVKEHLLNHVNIPEENVHAISTDDTSECSATRYEEDIRRFFDIGKDRFPDFDLIMLGIGEDGHTASLFPGTAALYEKRRLAIPVAAPRLPSERISLTLPVINNAKNIIFLVSGENKAKAIKELLENRNSRLPAALVTPDKGALFLVMDERAASLVSDAMADL